MICHKEEWVRKDPGVRKKSIGKKPARTIVPKNSLKVSMQNSNKLNKLQLEEWLNLKAIPGITDRIYKSLIDEFGSPGKVFKATAPQLAQIPEIKKDTVQAIIGRNEGISSFTAARDVSEEIRLAKKHKVDVVTLNHTSYPENLKAIYNPPPLVYVKGEIREEDTKAIAIVGSRKATTYGRLTAQRLSAQLAARGVTIVSGLARGIDSEAHKGALAVGGRTIAALGCGIDVVYPPENRALAARIASSGALVTEFPFATPPFAGNFPKRNRIISGLSLGVVIVEAAAKSGALITATFALEQGREVFAVPGPTTSSYSKGTNHLIKEGAKLVENIDDILEELESFLPPPEKDTKPENFLHPQLSGEEESIYSFITQEPKHIDLLIQESNLSAQQASVILTNLQLAGLIRELSGKNFIRKE
jgi:DNA processing protein